MNRNNSAINIIKNNSRGGFTIPCNELYPFQWNWDSAFSALGIYTYNKERALMEIDMLFKGQWDNGMIPHIIFHKEDDNYYPGPKVWESKTLPETSCITQPPVITTVIWFLILLGLNDNTKINEYYEKLLKYHKWFVSQRDPYNLGLISIFHPWESGRDNSPDWDDALENIKLNNDLNINRKDNRFIDESERPNDNDYNKYMQIVFKCKELNWNCDKIYDEGLFNMCDPGVQFIFIRACKDLYKIAGYLNKHDDLLLIEEWIKTYTNGCNLLWNREINCYTSLNIKNFKHSKEITSGSMLFSYANIEEDYKKEEMIKHSKRILRKVNYSFPSNDPDNKNFNNKKYWRGPIWCIMNFMLYLGFIQIHEYEISKNIKNNTIELINKNGFYEYYNPETGDGCGGTEFSWTASIYLIFSIDIFSN